MNFKVYSLVIFITISSFAYSQNIGQKGDSIINYIDINGKKQGYWKKKYKNENIAYEAYFRNDKIYGEYKRYYETGAIQALVKYDKAGNFGRAILYYDDGIKMAEGNYINQNVKDSTWKYYTTDGVLIIEETYKNSKKNGISKRYFRNGKVSQSVPWENGVINGVYTEYYESGQKLIETVYKKGINDGLFYRYHENNATAIKGMYKNNISEGKWQYFDSKGGLIQEIEFKNGKAINENKMLEEFDKHLKEWERNKGNIQEPSENNIFNNKNNSNFNEH